MISKLQRPGMKLANTKVTESDMIYFSLGLDEPDFILPSERDDYRSDPRAIQLLQDIRDGKDVSGKDYSGINLKNADISGAKLAGSSFKGAVFYKTAATDCDFTDCDFTEAYLEDTDFSHSWFTGACFKKTYLRRLTIDDARLDDEARRRITAMDFLIEQIESGAIDIHCLTKSELMCLDLRRLDMSKIDISDMDLSMFVLEGVNLRGVYVNPLQKLSMDNFQKDLLLVEQLGEKKLKEETLKTLKARKKELETYAMRETTERPDINAPVKTPPHQRKRPQPKQDEFARQEPVPAQQESKPTDIRPDTPEPQKIQDQQVIPKSDKKNKNRN